MFGIKEELTKGKFLMSSAFLAAVFSVVFSLIILEYSKKYEASVIVLVQPGSEIAASQIEVITNNAVELSRTYSFRDVLDQSSWSDFENENISVKQKKDSSMLEIAYVNKDKDAAKKGIKNITEKLMAFLKSYYNQEMEIKTVVVDGPVVQVKIESFFWIALVSILLGFSFSLLINLFISSVEKFLNEKIAATRNSRLAVNFSFPQNGVSVIVGNEKKVNESAIISMRENLTTEESLMTAEEKKAPFKKNEAPFNLPVAEVTESKPVTSSLIYDFPEISMENKTDLREEIAEKNESKNLSIEPSEEELKARLNQLLGK